MEEKSLGKFNNLAAFCNELESKANKKAIVLIASIFVTIIFLLLLYSKGYHNEDGGKMLFALLIIVDAISLFTGYKEINELTTMLANFKKNELEIKSTYLSGIYTENPKVTNNEKFFRIPYNEIEKIETRATYIKTGDYYNFIIYYSGGIIKLTIATPEDARKMIYNLMNEMEKTN